MDLRAILIRVRAFLAALAPVTPIKTDDAVVVVIDGILADAELFSWFERKVADDASGTLSLEGEPPVALQVVLEQRNIDWAKLIELAPVIISLVKLLRG